MCTGHGDEGLGRGRGRLGEGVEEGRLDGGEEVFTRDQLGAASAISPRGQGGREEGRGRTDEAAVEEGVVQLGTREIPARSRGGGRGDEALAYEGGVGNGVEEGDVDDGVGRREVGEGVGLHDVLRREGRKYIDTRKGVYACVGRVAVRNRLRGRNFSACRDGQQE